MFSVFIISCSHNILVGMVLTAVTEAMTHQEIRNFLLFNIIENTAVNHKVICFNGSRQDIRNPDFSISLLCWLKSVFFILRILFILVTKWLPAAPVAA